jgi:hypothetical protein
LSNSDKTNHAIKGRKRKKEKSKLAQKTFHQKQWNGSEMEQKWNGYK